MEVRHDEYLLRLTYNYELGFTLYERVPGYIAKHCSDVQSCHFLLSSPEMRASRAIACCLVVLNACLYVDVAFAVMYLRTGVADQGSDQVVKSASYDEPPIFRSVSRLLVQLESNPSRPA